LRFVLEAVLLGDQKLPITPGAWIHYSLSLPVGVKQGVVGLTVEDPLLGSRKMEMHQKEMIKMLTWIAFVLPGKSNSHVFMDNLEIKIENEMPLEDKPLVVMEQKTGWKETPSALLDLFPASTVQLPEEKQGRTVMSSNYYPSDSLWHESLDESWVFHQEIKHEQDKLNSFGIRIGKGGQLYSLRGAFGESIPPQGKGNPWNDEVWQFVAVCSKYNGTLLGSGSLSEELKKKIKASPYSQYYFIHNSGTYIPSAAGLNTLYCPMLGADTPDDGRTCRTLNWGLVPQVKTLNRSPILYYVQTRDIGNGIVEMTYVVHNFSVREDIVFDHLNAPWGGTRITRLPFHYLSKPDGTLMNREQMRELNVKDGIGVRETGGWNLSSQSEDPDSPSLALVYGRDRHLESELKKMKNSEPYCQFDGSLYRDWPAIGDFEFQGQDWQTRPENSFRNYEVAVVIPRLRLAPSTTIWYRSFLVINGRDRAIELSKSLVDQTDYGLLTFDPKTTPMLKVDLGGGMPAFELYAKPVPGTMPLFLVADKTTGQEIVTTDLYHFVPKEDPGFDIPPEHALHDYYSQAVGYSMDQHNSKWKRILGYAYVDQPDDDYFVQIADLLKPKQFPEVDTYHLNLWVKKEL